MSVTERLERLGLLQTSEHVNAARSERTGKYEQVNRCHLEMRSHVCLNRDRDFLMINCAALLHSVSSLTEGGVISLFHSYYRIWDK